MIRLAGDADLPGLREIERAAGRPFRDIGMTLVADHPPPTIAHLAAFSEDGRALVSTDGQDRPIGYLLLEIVDGDTHVEQVSVHPDHARRGIGRSLLEAGADWARQHRTTAMTLTTYADVPWNGPYYRRLGFVVLPEDQLGPGMQQVRRYERAAGLDQWPRVVMRRPLDRP